jgi:hypothetical protein
VKSISSVAVSRPQAVRAADDDRPQGPHRRAQDRSCGAGQPGQDDVSGRAPVAGAVENGHRDQGRGRSGAEDRQDPPLAVAVSEPGLGRSGQRPQGVETAGGAGDGEGVGGLVNDEQKR